MPEPTTSPVPLVRRVLLVDDDEDVRRVFARALRDGGFDVDVVGDGSEAVSRFVAGKFDAVVSDINMPGLDGVQLLRKLRELDLDMPVLLVTGQPSLDTAVKAVELGAHRYLQKPIDPDDLVRVVGQAADLCRLARVRRQLVDCMIEAPPQVGDRAGLEARFDRALEGLFMLYQPIVDQHERRVLGYEALMRSKESSIPHPGALLDAAERLDRIIDLGRAVRRAAVRPLDQAPADCLLFVNLHTHELTDDFLLSAESPLAEHAKRVVLEITERARLERVPNVTSRIQQLREVGYRIAIDDLGAGYAGLTSWAMLEPDVVKLDMALVRDIHLATTKRKLVGSIVQLCSEFGMLVVAEGVETTDERDALLELGCRYFQGYLYAKPAPPFVTPQF